MTPQSTLEKLFGRPRVLIGVVHLLPLPGSPGWGGRLDEVLRRAREDACALDAGGVNGVIVENFGDAPFLKGRVGAETVAAMTVAMREVRGATELPLGINVLRNDPTSAIAIAVATGARFIRVNVHIGAVVADEGLIEGQAAETIRYRRLLGSDVMVLADVMVKHSRPLGGASVAEAAAAAAGRGAADAVIVSGSVTGQPPMLENVRAAVSATPRTPVLLGSGVDTGNARAFAELAHGAIVGTSVKEDGLIGKPVDVSRVRRLAECFLR